MINILDSGKSMTQNVILLAMILNVKCTLMMNFGTSLEIRTLIEMIVQLSWQMEIK